MFGRDSVYHAGIFVWTIILELHFLSFVGWSFDFRSIAQIAILTTSNLRLPPCIYVVVGVFIEVDLLSLHGGSFLWDSGLHEQVLDSPGIHDFLLIGHLSVFVRPHVVYLYFCISKSVNLNSLLFNFD